MWAGVGGKRISSAFPLVAFLVVAFLSGAPAGGQEPEAIVIGQQFPLHSDILGETRPIQVHLPDNYNGSNEAYPVLYALDGESFFQYCVTIVDMLAPDYMPRMIIVGVPNTNRARDLRPSNEPPAEGEAGTLRFLRFLEQELIPHIATQYRACPYRVLAGHSMAGLFTLYAWVHEPDLFRAYIASSPGLDAPERRNLVLAGLRARTADPVTRQYLYISGGGDEPKALHDGIREFDAVLATIPPEKLEHSYDIFEGEGHVPAKSYYQGLRRIFPTWMPQPAFFQTGTLDEMKNHYAALAGQYGFSVSPPPDIINFVGGRLLRASQGQAALEVYQHYVSLYPRSAEGHLGLAWAYRQVGQVDRAVEAVGEALRLEPENAAARWLRDDLGAPAQR